MKYMDNVGFDEVLKSLKIIKYICKDARECEKCPFHNHYGDFCNITDSDPSQWNINENKDIKYFN